jgi:hypothetical protein
VTVEKNANVLYRSGRLSSLGILFAAKLAFFFVVQALYIRLAFYAILQQGSLSFWAAGKLTFYFVVQAIYIPLEFYRCSEVTFKNKK